MTEAEQADNEDATSYRYEELPEKAISLLQIPQHSIASLGR